MALIQSEVIEAVFDAAEKEAIIEKLTDAMVSAEGEAMRPVTWVTSRRSPGVTGASPARPCTQATSSACAPLPDSRAHHGVPATMGCRSPTRWQCPLSL
jgi:4-oxalocrotonate tautomerase